MVGVRNLELAVAQVPYDYFALLVVLFGIYENYHVLLLENDQLVAFHLESELVLVHAEVGLVDVVQLIHEGLPVFVDDQVGSF